MWSPTTQANFDRDARSSGPWSAATCRSDALRPARRRSVRPPGARCCRCRTCAWAAMVRNTSFSVFAGQITGVFGLVGSGPHRDRQGRRRRDQARHLPRRRGPAARAGRCATSCRAPAVRDGIVYVTEDRKLEGFFETMSIADNIYLGLLAKLRGKRKLVSKREACGRRPSSWIKRLKIRAISERCQGDRTVGRQPAEGRDRQVAGAGAGADHLRRADARRRCRRHRRDSSAHQSPGRRGHGGGGDLLLSARDHGAVRPHPGMPRMGKVVEEFSALEATEEKIMYAAIH